MKRKIRREVAGDQGHHNHRVSAWGKWRPQPPKNKKIKKKNEFWASAGSTARGALDLRYHLTLPSDVTACDGRICYVMEKKEEGQLL